MKSQENGGGHLLPGLEVEFEVVRELGRGGASVVYLAVERELEREVAIKTIHPMFAADADAAARLVREARTLARLQHPNIVTFYGIRRLADGGLAVVMQYVRGERLKDRVQARGALAFEEARAVLADVARALAHAHRHHVVHRDIKPENIYLDEELGIARLSDFGIARAWDRDGSLTQAGLAIGTPAYMAPEQIDGAALDGRSDLYSLGLVGWEMLSGERPWHGHNLYGIIYRQKTESLPPVETLRPDVPEGLRAAIARALEKDPELRWPSADAFLDCLAGDPVAARPRHASLLPAADAATAAPAPAPASFAGEAAAEAPAGMPADAGAPRPLMEDALTVPYRIEPAAPPPLEGEAALVAQLEWGLQATPDVQEVEDETAASVARPARRGRRRRTLAIAATLALVLAGSVSAISLLRWRGAAAAAGERAAGPARSASPLARLSASAVQPAYAAPAPAGPRIGDPGSAADATSAPGAAPTGTPVSEAAARPVVPPPPPVHAEVPAGATGAAAAGAAPPPAQAEPRLLGRPVGTPAPPRRPQPARDTAPGTRTGLEAPAMLPEATAAPAFVPFEVAPVLTNRADVQRALARFYPASARNAGLGGRAVIWVQIDSTGVVQKVQVKQSSGFGPLDQAALQVAAAMKFTPALNRDHRVAVWVAVPIDFSVR